MPSVQTTSASIIALTLNSHGFLYDERIAIAPIIPVHRVQTDPPIAHMDLESVPVMLQLVRPASTARRLLGDDWLARMDESSRRV